MKLYDPKNKRLLFFEKKASPAFWDSLWNNEMKNIDKKKKTFVVRITKKYLKKGSRILDGGSGSGHKVYALAYNGYDSYGIDFAKNTVKKINKILPELKIYHGDVRKTFFDEGYFDGYWSLGVIEHFYEGYEDILKEINRLLKKGGYLFLTFPYMSPLRRLKAKFGLYEIFKGKKHPNFYQFALNKKQVIRDLEKINFKFIYQTPIDGFKGLQSEINFLKPFFHKISSKKGMISDIIKKGIAKSFERFSGHIILLVFKKEEGIK